MSALIAERTKSGALLRTFERISDEWKLTAAERSTLLGEVPKSTYADWKRLGDRAPLSRDTIERLTHIAAIFMALEILVPIPAEADRWVRTPNRATFFGDRAPLDRMLEGGVSDLFAVRQYLDAQRGGWS